MLYLGNFSYTDVNDEDDNYCLMPAVVDAPDTDTALARFEELLRRLHDTSELLRGAEHIYLDSLVELSEMPQEAMLVQWQKIVGSEDGLYSVLNALPGDEAIAEAYAWGEEDDFGPGEKDDEDDPDEDEGETLEFEGERDPNEEVSPEDLATVLTEALDLLTQGDLAAIEDDGLDANEEAFISFVD